MPLQKHAALRVANMILNGNKLHAYVCASTCRLRPKRLVASRAITCSANGSSRKTTIHKLIEQQGTLLVPGVHDALSAKALAHTGHISAFVSGYAVSNACDIQAGHACCYDRMGAVVRCFWRCHARICSRRSGPCELSSCHNGYRTHFGMQVSATLLGEPDVGLLTPPEMSRKTSQICMSIPQIPVIVDADTGKLVKITTYIS